VDVTRNQKYNLIHKMTNCLQVDWQLDESDQCDVRMIIVAHLSSQGRPVMHAKLMYNNELFRVVQAPPVRASHSIAMANPQL
jgi:hypothetical protein